VVVADTDVLIDALERREPRAVARVSSLMREGELATTAVTLFEPTAGSRTTPGQLEVIHAALAAVSVLPFTRGSNRGPDGRLDLAPGLTVRQRAREKSQAGSEGRHENGREPLHGEGCLLAHDSWKAQVLECSAERSWVK
jgi:hypothetical protein